MTTSKASIHSGLTLMEHCNVGMLFVIGFSTEDCLTWTGFDLFDTTLNTIKGETVHNHVIANRAVNRSAHKQAVREHTPVP
jgi:hypothetical protein